LYSLLVSTPGHPSYSGLITLSFYPANYRLAVSFPPTERNLAKESHKAVKEWGFRVRRAESSIVLRVRKEGN
jgi:hypothetical protein